VNEVDGCRSFVRSCGRCLVNGRTNERTNTTNFDASMHSFIHSFVRPFVHSFIRKASALDARTRALVLWACSFVRMFVGFVRLCVCAFVRLCVCGFVGLWVCACVELVWSCAGTVIDHTIMVRGIGLAMGRRKLKSWSGVEQRTKGIEQANGGRCDLVVVFAAAAAVLRLSVSSPSTLYCCCALRRCVPTQQVLKPDAEDGTTERLSKQRESAAPATTKRAKHGRRSQFYR